MVVQEQLEEVWQEMEHLRARNDALAADNATLRAERSASDASPAKPPRPGTAAENGDTAHHGDIAAALEAAQRQVLDLQVQPLNCTFFCGSNPATCVQWLTNVSGCPLDLQPV